MRNFFGLIGLLGVLQSAPAIAQENTMKVYCGNKSLNIELADNQSAKAFAEKLSAGDITVKMSDYGNFEKTGSLGFDDCARGFDTSSRDQTLSNHERYVWRGGNRLGTFSRKRFKCKNGYCVRSKVKQGSFSLIEKQYSYNQ